MITTNTQQTVKEFESIGFEIEITADNSPTLRLQNQGESMHHSGGAAAETLYIYGSVLINAHQILRDSCKTCVVGLGLGYIEISWAISLLKNNLVPSVNLSFHSFELVTGLTEIFYAWIHSEDLHPVYDLIVAKLDANISLQAVKLVLRQALKNGSTLNADFTDFEQHRERYNIVCYDAFSKKTNENLWLAEFLDSFFKEKTADDCVVTTYACTGVFRQALQRQNFLFFKRPGFCGKRDSSLAVKGKFDLKSFQPTSQISSCIQ